MRFLPASVAYFLGAGGSTLLFCGAVAAEETVVVRGARPVGDADEPELSVGSVEGEDLRQPGVDAADVLGRAPGVQVTRSGSSADLATVSIRGADASQVPVYLAGIRVNDDVAGVADLSRLPLWMMHRVRIYRGAGPLDAARGGMTGALFFEPTLPRNSGYRVGAEGGSFGAGAVWLGATMEHPSDEPSIPWATSVSVKHSGAENDFRFKSDEGTAFVAGDDVVQTRSNADFSEMDFWAISRGLVRVGDTDARVTVLYNHLSREQGVSGLSLVPATRARAELARDLGGVSSKITCNFAERCEVVASTGYQKTFLATLDPEGELNLGAARIEQRGRRASENLRLLLSHNRKLESYWGVSGELSHLLLDDTEGALSRAQERFIGLSGSLRFAPRSDRFLRVALNEKCASVQGSLLGAGTEESRERVWSSCLPEARVGAFKSFQDRRQNEVARLRASAHSGVRFPTLGQRFGVSAVTRGNPELDVERAFTVDVGGTLSPVPQKWGQGFIDASIFQRNARSLIAYQRSALGYVRPFNVGSARFLGGELTAEMTLFRHIRERSTLTLLDPRDTTEGRTTENDLLVFRSQVTATEEVEVFHAARGKTLSYAGLSTTLSYRSGRVADPAGLIVIPEQAIFDLNGRIQFVDQMDLRARLENVFGAARYDALGFPLPGRSLYLSLEIASK